MAHCPLVHSLIFPVETSTDSYLLRQPFKGYSRPQQLQFIVDSVDLSRKRAFADVRNVSCRHLSLFSDWVRTESGYWVPILRVVDISAQARGVQRLTAIYSHANAEHFGKIMIEDMAQMAAECDIDVVLYEYAGYSFTQDDDGDYLHDKVSDLSCCESLAAVYAHCTKPTAELGYGLSPSDIVLYGRSLGTGVTMNLAASLEQPVASIILYSPYESVCSIALSPHVKQLCCFCPGHDMLDSIHKVPSVKAGKICILHGTLDPIVPHSNGAALAQAFRDAGADVTLMSAVGAEHNNVRMTLELFDRCMHDELRRAMYNTQHYKWQELPPDPLRPPTKPRGDLTTMCLVVMLTPLLVACVVFTAASVLYSAALVVIGPWAAHLDEKYKNVWYDPHTKVVHKHGAQIVQTALELLFTCSLILPFSILFLLVIKGLSFSWSSLTAIFKGKYEERKLLHAKCNRVRADALMAYKACLVYQKSTGSVEDLDFTQSAKPLPEEMLLEGSIPEETIAHYNHHAAELRKVCREVSQMDHSLDSPLAMWVRSLSWRTWTLLSMGVAYFLAFVSTMVLCGHVLKSHDENKHFDNDLYSHTKSFAQGLLAFWFISALVALPLAVWYLRRWKKRRDADNLSFSAYELEPCAWVDEDGVYLDPKAGQEKSGFSVRCWTVLRTLHDCVKPKFQSYKYASAEGSAQLSQTVLWSGFRAHLANDRSIPAEVDDSIRNLLQNEEFKLQWPPGCFDYIESSYANQDGTISWPQFWSALQDGVKLRDLFSTCDVDMNGRLSPDELCRTLKRRRLDSEMLTEALSEFDPTEPWLVFREFCRTTGLCLPFNMSALDPSEDLTFDEFIVCITQCKRRVEQARALYCQSIFRLIFLLKTIQWVAKDAAVEGQLECSALYDMLLEDSQVQNDLELLARDKLYNCSFALQQLQLGNLGVWFPEGKASFGQFEQALKCEIEVVHLVSQLTEPEGHQLRQQLSESIERMQRPDCFFALWPFQEAPPRYGINQEALANLDLNKLEVNRGPQFSASKSSTAEGIAQLLKCFIWFEPVSVSLLDSQEEVTIPVATFSNWDTPTGGSESITHLPASGQVRHSILI